MKTTNNNIWLLAAVAATLFTACATDDSDYYSEPDPVNFTASTGEAFSGTIGTRAYLNFFNGGNSSSTKASYNYDILWNRNDSLFVWCPTAQSNSSTSINPYATYVTENGKSLIEVVNGSKGLHWSNATDDHTFCAIYPASSVTTKTPSTSDTELKFQITMPKEYTGKKSLDGFPLPMFARHTQKKASTINLNFRPACTVLVATPLVNSTADTLKLYAMSVEMETADGTKKGIVGKFEGTLSVNSTDSMPTYRKIITSNDIASDTTKLLRTFTPIEKIKDIATGNNSYAFPLILTSPLAENDKIIIKLYTDEELTKGWKVVTSVSSLKERTGSSGSYAWGDNITSLKNGSVISVTMKLFTMNHEQINYFDEVVSDTMTW